jgi:hypothetical protein
MFGFPRISEEGGAMARMISAVTASAEPCNSASESALLHQLLEASKQLAQEVEAAWQTAPQSAAMFQAPGRVK